jgi:hypothetical protein
MGNFLTWVFGKKQSKEETSSTIPVSEENNPLPLNVFGTGTSLFHFCLKRMS